MRAVIIRALLIAAICLPTIAEQVPDFVLLNGRIFTCDHSRPWAEGVAIAGNMITAVGTSSEIAALAGPDTKRIDLKGRLVIPGINDAHAELALPLELFKLTTTVESSTADVAVALISGADESPATAWLIGTISSKLFHDPAVTAAAIEKIAPGRKVTLESPNGRARVLSVSAMNALRIDWSAPDPVGGWFERDVNGHLTGKAFEYAASNVERALSDQVSDDVAVAALRNFALQSVQSGVTSVQATVSFPISRFEKIVRHADVALRIRMIRSPPSESRGRDTIEGSQLLRRDRERKLSDVFGTSWVVDETEPGGRLDFPAAEIAKILSESLASNDPLILSFAGSGSIAALVDTMKGMDGIDWKSKRVRFDDSDAFPPALLPAAKSLGIVVVQTPAHSSLKNLFAAGIPVALSEGGEINPFQNIMLAAQQASREEAVEAYTRGGAFAEFSENEKGTIAAGKVADLVVLSQDIFKAKMDDVAGTGCILTILGGKIVHDSGVLDVPGRKRPKVPSPDLPF